VKRGQRLGRGFFEQPTVELAKALIGCWLVHRTDEGVAAGRVVETEAYLATEDDASHSSAGETARNRAMFGTPGKAYVYMIYGVHHCLNVVSAERGVGEAILLRALEPLEGLDLMRARRGGVGDRGLCSGPGKLVQALGVTREQDGGDFTQGPLGLWAPAKEGTLDEIAKGPRIGIRKAASLPLRFWIAHSPWASR
jgi:DNA-3-methyladenine glycosylase